LENIFQKSFDNITNADIQNLIDIKYKECQRMEYKKEMYSRNDNGTKEMLRDISAIANAYGGYLIIGIEADKKGIPKNPINVDNAEIERDRIEKSCLSSIEPRISGLKCKTVQVSTGENIIVVFIPRSLKKPHMVTFSGLNQFWKRYNDKKLHMSVEEIRDACISIENVWKDVKQFLDEQQMYIRQQISSRGGMVIASVPALIREEFIDIRDPKIKKFLIDPPNQYGESFSLSFKSTSTPVSYPEPTLNGLRIKYENKIEVQLFRNGYYELKLDGPEVYDNIDTPEFSLCTPCVIEFTVNYFRALGYLVEQYGIETSLVAFVNLYNTQNLKLKYKAILPEIGAMDTLGKKLETPDLLIPPKQIISFDNPDSIAKSFLEKIWNAFGFEEVPSFKDDKYNPDKKFYYTQRH